MTSTFYAFAGLTPEERLFDRISDKFMGAVTLSRRTFVNQQFQGRRIAAAFRLLTASEMISYMTLLENSTKTRLHTVFIIAAGNEGRGLEAEPPRVPIHVRITKPWNFIG